MRRRGHAGIGIAFTIALLAATAASAQEDREVGPRGRRVVRIAETRIEGRIQKPQAFYILQRSNLSFESLELKNSFVPKILRSVREEPF